MSSSNKPKLLSDENIPIKVTRLLKEKGFDIVNASLNSTDKKISKTAKSESRVILTFDKHFLNKRLFSPKEHHGIIFIDIHPPLIETVYSSLLNFFEKVSQPELEGKLFVLSSFGFRIKSSIV